MTYDFEIVEVKIGEMISLKSVRKQQFCQIFDHHQLQFALELKIKYKVKFKCWDLREENWFNNWFEFMFE
jgi:hypothetical protein